MVRNINFGKLTPIVFPFKASTRRKFAMGWVGITAAQLLFNFVTKTLDFINEYKNYIIIVCILAVIIYLSLKNKK